MTEDCLTTHCHKPKTNGFNRRFKSIDLEKYKRPVVVMLPIVVEIEKMVLDISLLLLLPGRVWPGDHLLQFRRRFLLAFRLSVFSSVLLMLTNSFLAPVLATAPTTQWFSNTDVN